MLLRQGRYRELLLVVETCQAESLHFKLRSPGILSIAASKVGAPMSHDVASAQAALRGSCITASCKNSLF